MESMVTVFLEGSSGDCGGKEQKQKAGYRQAERQPSGAPCWLPPLPPPDISISLTCPQALPDPEVLLDKHQLQKLSRFLLDPWVYRASMASLASRGTLGFKALWASKVRRTPATGDFVREGR